MARPSYLGASRDGWAAPGRRLHIIRGVSQTSAVLLSVVAGPPSDLATDVLVTFVADGAGPDGRVDPATGGALASLLGGTELRRKAFETAWLPVVPRGAAATRVLVVGSGRPADLTPERWRRLGIVAGLAVRQRRFGRLACLVPDAEARPDVVQALAEGSSTRRSTSTPTRPATATRRRSPRR